jgi:hypothetical protein
LAHPEGNPHSNQYFEIANGSFNLILQSSPEIKELSRQIPEIEIFSIFHKRNGEHRVFQFKKDTRLTKFAQTKAKPVIHSAFQPIYRGGIVFSTRQFRNAKNDRGIEV